MVDWVILGSVMAARLCCSLRAEGGGVERRGGELYLKVMKGQDHLCYLEC